MKIKILNIKIYFSQLCVSNENKNIKHKKNIFASLINWCSEMKIVAYD